MCSFTVLGGSGGVRKPVSIWCDHHLRTSSATHLLRIEMIRLLIVACGMLVHSSSMAVRSCWILEGTGTRCCIRRYRASQTCSMGDMSGEYAGHARTGCFQLPVIVVQDLATWGDGRGWMEQQWASGARISGHNNGHQKMTCVSSTGSAIHNPPHHGHSIHNVTITNVTPSHTHCCPVQWNRSSEENT